MTIDGNARSAQDLDDATRQRLLTVSTVILQQQYVDDTPWAIADALDRAGMLAAVPPQEPFCGNDADAEAWMPGEQFDGFSVAPVAAEAWMFAEPQGWTEPDPFAGSVEASIVEHTSNGRRIIATTMLGALLIVAGLAALLL